MSEEQTPEPVEAKAEQKEEVSEVILDLCTEPEKIIHEINELNVGYKLLINKKVSLIKELQRVEEGIQKAIGAYQALKKLYVKAINVKKEKYSGEKANV